MRSAGSDLRDRVAPLHDRDAAVVEQLLEPEVVAAPGPGRGGTRRRARRGSRPSYSCTIVNVGLVTGSSTPEPARQPLRERRLARAEIADEHHEVAGASSCEPTAAPTASRLRAPVVVSVRHRSCDAGERALHADEVGARLGQRLAARAQHRRRMQRRDQHRVDAGARERELRARAAS